MPFSALPSPADGRAQYRTGLEDIRPGAPIAAALSGGIDSREAARIILENGAKVKAFHLWLHNGPAVAEALEKTKDAAADLQLDLEVIDLRPQFKRLIIDYFIDSYRRGQTPSPCLLCNPTVKFGLLLEETQKRGFEYLATGHYAAKYLKGGDPAKSLLARPRDLAKDQSYFLSRLSGGQLAKSIWPLAGHIKTQLKAVAENGRYQAPPDSQEICFISGDYRRFIEEALGLGAFKPGDFIGPDGQVMGRHRGLINYTVGQRRGLNLPGPCPYYVTALNAGANQVVIGPKEALASRTLKLYDVVLNLDHQPGQRLDCLIQIRSRHKAAPASLTILNGNLAEAEFIEPQSAITPGQGAAIYAGDICLGGGWIAG